jgi:hypothetical protein
VSQKQFNLILILALVTFCVSTVNAIWAFHALSAPWFTSADSFTLHINRNFFRPRTRIFVEIAFLVSIVSFWVRTKKSFMISALALIGVELAYAIWLFKTYEGVENAESSSYSTIQQHAYLGGANWLDVFVWGACTIMLLWLTVVLSGISLGNRGKTLLA